MAADRWTARKAVVVGSSGRQAPVEARTRTPEESGLGTVVSIALMACLVSVSFFFPPVLLLNIPILVFRAAALSPRNVGGRDLVAELLRRRKANGSFAGRVNTTAFAAMALKASGGNVRIEAGQTPFE